jgi:hypothetical protein
MVLLAIPCKAGMLQVLEEGIVEMVTANRRVWTLSYSSITRLTAHQGERLLTLLVYTRHGIYQAGMVTPEDFARFCACFPHLPPRKKRTSH